MKELLINSFVVVFLLPSVLGFTFNRAKRELRVNNVKKRQTDSSSSSEEAIAPLYYNDQCVDHSDCSKKFTQRYWESNEYYNPGGPLFMMLGGEGDLSGWINGGAWVDYAASHDAYMLAVEHRFYGESFPTPQTDRSAQAMQILTSQQALMDYARILKWFKEKNKLQTAKVVSFGGSYSGALSAWFKQQYPELVNVAVASSAPLNYTYNFTDYVGTASRVIKESNPQCFDRIKSTFTCIEQIVNGQKCAHSSITDKNDLPAKLHMCSDLDNEMDTEGFFIDAGFEIWATNTPGTNSSQLCPILLDQNSKDIVKSYGRFIKQSNNTNNCSYSRRRRQVDNLAAANSTNDPGGYNYSWFWQSCNEFIDFENSDPTYAMLGANTFGSNYQVNSCQYWYPDANFTAESIIANVEKTRAQYKSGKEFNGTCVIFVNGSWDPWATKGMTSQNDTSDKNIVFYYEKGEHCDDMESPPINPFVPKVIKKIQKKVKKQIGTYLQNADC